MVESRTIASAAVFTAFVAVATAVFSVSIPATRGYFNVGEVMVYISALLMGPFVGAFAGGVGSMLSDISLGYANYAPGTLAVKGIEGFIVGYLSRMVLRRQVGREWKAISIGAALLFSVSFAYVGATYLSPDFSPTFGGVWGIPAYTVTFDLPQTFWIVLAAVSFLAISYFGMRADPGLGVTVLAVLLGGAEMVSGYFLYESYALGLGTVTASAEIPFNVAQALVGLLVSFTVVKSYRRIMGVKDVPGSPPPSSSTPA